VLQKYKHRVTVFRDGRELYLVIWLFYGLQETKKFIGCCGLNNKNKYFSSILDSYCAYIVKA